MEEQRKNIDEIIIASFSGEANSDELNYLRNWLNLSTDNQQTFEKLRQFWFNSYSEFSVSTQEAQFDKLQTELSVNNSGKKVGIFPAMRWAAVILLFISFAVAYWLSQGNVNNPAQVAEVVKMIKSNPAGQKSLITLPDSSQVWLNAQSTLTYYIPFNENRKLLLQGEAYFKVAHNPQSPFVVTTGNISTEAVGTAFNIKTSQKGVHVDLIQGKVKIENVNDYLKESILLNPGEGISYEEEQNILTRHPTNLEEVLYWKDNILYFKRASFNEVISELQKWYGVQFFVAENMDRQWVFTGKFENESLKNVLLAISFAKKFDFTIEDKKIYVSPQNINAYE